MGLFAPIMKIKAKTQVAKEIENQEDLLLESDKDGEVKETGYQVVAKWRDSINSILKNKLIISKNMCKFENIRIIYEVH